MPYASGIYTLPDLQKQNEGTNHGRYRIKKFPSVLPEVHASHPIPEPTPRILHEFVEKIVIHAAADPHSKINRRQEVDICCKGSGILEMSKVFDSKQK